MPSWTLVLVIALGGGLLLEGAMYALFPSGIKKAMQEILGASDNVLRVSGLCVAAVGVLIVYLGVPKV